MDQYASNEVRRMLNIPAHLPIPPKVVQLHDRVQGLCVNAGGSIHLKRETLATLVVMAGAEPFQNSEGEGAQVKVNVDGKWQTGEYLSKGPGGRAKIRFPGGDTKFVPKENVIFGNEKKEELANV